MKILVLGATGMLGHKMFQILRERFPDTHGAIRSSINDPRWRKVTLFQRGNVIDHFDAAETARARKILLDLRPQVIVNCVGLIKQRSEAKDAAANIALNALLPHQLAEICGEYGARLIQISTDCIFSGSRGNYTEEDPSDAEDLYGRTKYLGEVARENTLTLRTSIIGRELIHRQSLLEWFLSQNSAKVRGFKHAWYSGVTTNHLAEAVGDLIQKFPGMSGLYQLTSPTITKYELLCLLREAYQLHIEIVPDESFYCNRSLDGDKFNRETGYQSPPWPTLVERLVDDPTPYQLWRN
ncbi:MAG TPA: SDR family oxidoreductase [Blastocatellia bacterium]|nr:SDR family oxidoreductase [Blastocatellia bacterium]